MINSKQLRWLTTMQCFSFGTHLWLNRSAGFQLRFLISFACQFHWEQSIIIIKSIFCITFPLSFCPFQRNQSVPQSFCLCECSFFLHFRYWIWFLLRFFYQILLGTWGCNTRRDRRISLCDCRSIGMVRCPLRSLKINRFVEECVSFKWPVHFISDWFLLRIQHFSRLKRELAFHLSDSLNWLHWPKRRVFLYNHLRSFMIELDWKTVPPFESQ